MWSSPEIFDLDRNILQSDASWADNVQLWIADPSEKMPKTHISRMNHLLYVRAMSRVLIDFMTVKWNEGKTEDSRVTLLAEGSVHLTSDYDVSFAGAGSSLLAQSIEQAFLKQTGYRLSEYADTNLYVLPILSLTAERIGILGLANLLHLSPLVDGRDVTTLPLYIPYPRQENGGVEKSRQSAMIRLRQAQKRAPPITKQDGPKPAQESIDLLFKSALQFEEIVYKSTAIQWGNLWDRLARIQSMSPDAYHSMGAFCVVVVEMQRFKEAYNFECTSLYLDSAMENIACLLEHSFHLNVSPPEEYSVLLQTIKYVYRAVYSLDKICKQTPKIQKVYGAKLDLYLQIVRSANRDRGTTSFRTSDVYTEYVRILPFIQELLLTVIPECP